jgi:RND family efflux transporter MFP subunit
VRAALAIFLLATAAGCGREVRTEQAPAASPERVEAAPPPSEVAGTIAAILYSERDADVRARGNGVVREVLVELGDAVRAGQLLARLEDDAEDAALASATVAADFARLEHERGVELHERQAIHRAELDRLAYAARSAAAALRQAEVRLEYTRVRAPFAGVVTRRSVRIGQNVDPGEALFRTTALAPLRVQLRVPETHARSLVRGAPVPLTGPGGERLEARVARVAAAVDPLSGTVDVLLDVVDAAGLGPGSTVAVLLAGLTGGRRGTDGATSGASAAMPRLP